MDQQPLPPLPPDLRDELLRVAGIAAAPEEVVLLGASTAQVWALRAAGADYVVRFQPDGDAQAARKEQYLSDLLRQHGVPAPVVLAVVAGAQGRATLATRLPGVPLPQALATLTPEEAEAAWRSAGAALAQAHAIPFAEAGEIVGDQVEPFAQGWGEWVVEDLAGDVRWLAAHLGTGEVDPAALEQVVTAGAALLAARPVRLIHNDALPQNILVARESEGWRSSGWVDWEFSRAGDPLWDVVTLDLPTAGLVPASFYIGYGALPPPWSAASTRC